jgi:hypothetical protein
MSWRARLVGQLSWFSPGIKDDAEAALGEFGSWYKQKWLRARKTAKENRGTYIND